MVQETARAVSIRASKNYIAAMKKLASDRNQPIADLVRDCIDACMGDDLSKIVSFFDSLDYKNSQTDDETGS